jgi:hypothetical protein
MAKQTLEELNAQAQQQKGALNQIVQSQPVPVTKTFDPFADKQFLLGGMLLAFSLAVLIIFAYLIKRGTDVDALLRSFGTILIIIAAIFLTIAGYEEQQIAPVIGLLGTVAGYLLGQAKVNMEKKEG